MKRYLLLLVIAIFCLPNNSFAQQYGTPGYYGEQIYSRQSALAKIWADGKYGGTTWKGGRNSAVRIFAQEGAKSKYVTEITIDETTGLATAYWVDGAVYRGETYLEEIRGIGTITNPDGSQYSGEWKYNLPNGKGKFTDANRVTYSAKFIGGAPHGKGIIEDADGNKFSVRWDYGKLREKSIRPYKEKKKVK